MNLFIVAGEMSGDLHGEKLLSALFKENPHLHIGAVAGFRMRSFPIHTYLNTEELQVMGFIDVAKSFFRLMRHFFFIRDTILRINPKGVLLIDYPGFNLRLETSLRKKGYTGKLFHFVSPTVWAWKKNRILQMEQALDHLFVLLPFEKKCFENTSLPVSYVGHPLTSTIPNGSFKREKLLALFPGSRKVEIERNLPLQLSVAKELQKKDPSLSIGISVSHPEREKEILSHVSSQEPIFLYKDTYALMRKAHLAIATSGTVTLELCLHNTPSVVQFAIRPIDLFLAQKVFKINLPFYALPNLILQKEVFPELFGPNLTQEALLTRAEALWFDPEKRDRTTSLCQEVRAQLSLGDAAEMTAKEVLSSLYTE